MSSKKAKLKKRALLLPWQLRVILVFDTAIEVAVMFLVFTWLTGLLFGQSIPGGTTIYGWAAVVPLVLTIGYFILMSVFLGGTLAARLNRWMARAKY